MKPHYFESLCSSSIISSASKLQDCEYFIQHEQAWDNLWFEALENHKRLPKSLEEHQVKLDQDGRLKAQTVSSPIPSPQTHEKLCVCVCVYKRSIAYLHWKKKKKKDLSVH